MADFLTSAYFLAFPFFLLLILINWLGFRFKHNYLRKFPGIKDVGIGPTEGSLLGLTALLLSFTFGMSATKYDYRRKLIVEEANSIGTTIQRCDLYSDSVRDVLRKDLRIYVETRIAYYDAGRDETAIRSSIDRANQIVNTLWKKVAGLSHDLNNRVASGKMIPALNDTIDLIITREAARRSMVPPTIIAVLCILIFVSAFLSGYGSKKLERNRVLVFAFASMTTLAFFLVIDLERPREGVVNLESAEQFIVDLRAEFK